MKIWKRFALDFKNEHPFMVNFRDGCSNATGEERWILFLNSVVTAVTTYI